MKKQFQPSGDLALDAWRLYQSFNASERHGVLFGLFPNAKMPIGVDPDHSRLLVSTLMTVAAQRPNDEQIVKHIATLEELAKS